MMGTIGVCIAALTIFTASRADQPPRPTYVTEIPAGYRDWRVIFVAHEEDDLHSFAVVLGNDVTIKAYREKILPYPDGAIIAALHYKHVASEENNKVFGQEQSFVAGAPTNIQFMVKDSKKYAATGGWGFAHFNNDGKPADAKLLSVPSTDERSRSCFYSLRTLMPQLTVKSRSMRHEHEN
jgi:hypothetical protein